MIVMNLLPLNVKSDKTGVMYDANSFESIKPIYHIYDPFYLNDNYHKIDLCDRVGFVENIVIDEFLHGVGSFHNEVYAERFHNGEIVIRPTLMGRVLDNGEIFDVDLLHFLIIPSEQDPFYIVD